MPGYHLIVFGTVLFLFPSLAHGEHDIISGIATVAAKVAVSSATQPVAIQLPGYGNYCGPRTSNLAPIDCMDKACQTHDSCVGPFNATAVTKLRKCDKDLARDAGQCLRVGCNAAPNPNECRAAALVIGPWMATPELGTAPGVGMLVEGAMRNPLSPAVGIMQNKADEYIELFNQFFR